MDKITLIISYLDDRPDEVYEDLDNRAYERIYLGAKSNRAVAEITIKGD